MSDAQNERTKSRGRRRDKRSRHGERHQKPAIEQVERVTNPSVEVTSSPVAATPKFVRPADIAPPTDRAEIYCTHHTAVATGEEPVNFRSNSEMTTVRHLPVDHFGEATLFCDCLHNGPHEWPPMLQRVESAIELDQFRTDSTSDA